MTPAAMIDTRKIPHLELKLLGITGYEAMVRFYEDPENVQRFEEWQKERNSKKININQNSKEVNPC